MLLNTLMTELQSIADTNCPDNTGVYIIDVNDQTTWGFNPSDTATQQQIDTTNAAIQALSLTPYADEIAAYNAMNS